MMKLNRKRYFFTVLVVLFSWITYSCVPNEAPIPKRIDLDFEIGNVGNELVNGQDTLEVTEFKMLMQKFILSTDTQARLESNFNEIILRYQAINSGQFADVIAAELGFTEFDTFTGIEIFIAPAGANSTIPDRDFFQDEDRFSIIIKGQFNGEEFIYRSQKTFNDLLEFENSKLNDNNETLRVLITGDIADIFVDQQNNQILSPIDENNTVRLDSLLENMLQAEAQAVSSLPFN